MSLSVLRDPGSYGADVVVGEGQPLGVPMNFGGPHMGIFAVRDMGLARSMPGRLIGMTTTKDGSEKAFCMVLQTREQHIRREAATSNICTNQALLALAAAGYLSLLGKNGFRKLGEVNVANSHYAAERLGEVEGVEGAALRRALLQGVRRRLREAQGRGGLERLAKRGVMAGYPLTEHFPEIGEAGAYCVTEVHSTEDIGRLVDALGRRLRWTSALRWPGGSGRHAGTSRCCRRWAGRGGRGSSSAEDPKIRGVEGRGGRASSRRGSGGARSSAARDRRAPGAEALQQALADELLGRDGDVPAGELHDEVQPEGLRVHRRRPRG